jgi:tRNA-dihydrouridine synthase B
MKKIRIKNLVLKNPFFLAPMVDVTDLPYRMLCRKYGASIAYTEMINIGAIIHENKKTKMMMETAPEDKPLGVQITGNTIDEFEKVLLFLDKKKFDLIDLNCGCPSVRIVGNKSGSYLLKDPEKIAGIIKVLKKAGWIVTAKIRLGFEKNEVMKITDVIEKAGADLITIHARTAKQRNKEPAQWEWIRKVKEKSKIPIIGNGGITDGKTANEILKFADGAMIAMGALGNPMIFREAIEYSKEKKEKEITEEERISSFLEYISLAEKYNLLDIKRVKFLGGYFLRGFNGASKKRAELMNTKTMDEIKKLVKES